MKKVCFTLVLLTSLLVGCNQQLKIDDYMSEVDENSKKSVAEQYVSNLLVQEKLLTSNSRSVLTTELALFEEIEIEDKNGNKISYSDLNEEDKVLVVNDWYEETVGQLQEKIDKDSSIEEMLIIENKAFSLTMEDTSRSILPCTVENFISLYSNNLSKLLKDSTGARATAKKGEITSDTEMNENSVNIIKSKWKKGRLLVCTDTNSSSASFYLGHASMMFKDWSDQMEKNAMTMATYTSSPIDKSAQWKGKIDGVQEEPIGYWVGLGSACAKKVCILNVRSSKWSFGWKYTVASDSDYNKAAAEIDDYAGTPYGLSISKDLTNKIYCSQLCYLAWKDVADKYKINSGLLTVTPSELISSRDTTLEGSINNDYFPPKDSE